MIPDWGEKGTLPVSRLCLLFAIGDLLKGVPSGGHQGIGGQTTLSDEVSMPDHFREAVELLQIR